MELFSIHSLFSERKCELRKHECVHDDGKKLLFLVDVYVKRAWNVEGEQWLHSFHGTSGNGTEFLI